MAAARHEAEVGRLDRVVAERAGHHVPVQVVHRHERQPARGGERLRGRDADEQRADQPGSARDRDLLDVVEPRAGPLERVGGHRVDQLQVVARGDLRHHAAVARVQQPLRGDHVREDPAVVADDRGAGVVAARLDGEDHAVVRLRAPCAT